MTLNFSFQIAPQLEEGFARGEPKAFQRIFLNHYPRLCREVYRLTCDEALAEDLVLDAFAALWENRKQPEVADDPGAYLLHAIQLRLLLEVKLLFTEGLPHARLPASGLVVSYKRPVEGSITDETMLRFLQDALKAMPGPYRVCWALRYLGKWEPGDFASAGVPSGSRLDEACACAWSMLKSALIRYWEVIPQKAANSGDNEWLQVFMDINPGPVKLEAGDAPKFRELLRVAHDLPKHFFPRPDTGQERLNKRLGNKKVTMGSHQILKAYNEGLYKNLKWQFIVITSFLVIFLLLLVFVVIRLL
jgi:DNA-directed RNA polymerase specialized sigma24 family protein